MSSGLEYPPGMTRQECMDGLRIARDLAVAAEIRKDGSFVRWPDLDALLDWSDQRHEVP